MNSTDKISKLYQWCLIQTKNKGVELKNFTTSWRNGIVFCAILQNYTTSIDISELSADDIYNNNNLAYTVAEDEFGIPRLLDPNDMVAMKTPDRLSVITYLFQFYSSLYKLKKLEPPTPKTVEDIARTDEVDSASKTSGDDKENSSEDIVSICVICQKPVFILEKFSVSEKIYHRKCYRQIQLDNLKIRNRTLERVKQDKNEDKDNTDESLNPKSEVNLSDNEHFRKSTNNNSKELSSRKGKAPQPPKVVKRKKKLNTVETSEKVEYPDNLNPFGEVTNNSLKNSQKSSKELNPFSEYMTDESSPEKIIDSKQMKKTAPLLPISVSDESENTHLKLIIEEKTEENSLQLREKSKAQSGSDTDSKRSSKQKQPAPSRPVPPKRQVCGSTKDFVPFESLYLQLEELNKKQSDVEERGRKIQNELWQANDQDETFEGMLQDWLDLINEKNELFSTEKRLHEILKRQELEERHAELEHELRELLAVQESLKNAAQKAREEELINQILDTVNRRAQMIENDSDNPVIIPNLEMRKKKSKGTLKKLFSKRSTSMGRSTLSFRKSLSLSGNKETFGKKVRRGSSKLAS